MTHDYDLDERLLQWQDRRDRGISVTPEELCDDRPELAGELRHRIKALAAMESLLGPRDGDDETPVDRRAPVGEGAARSLAIPGYAIESEIGRGGMGIVYRAHCQRLGRAVAIKVLLAGEQASATQRDRFLREARAQATLDHPNIVRILQVGETDGHFYIVMELIEGGSLADRLSQQVLPAKFAAGIVRELARAAGCAHGRGIVHRDLKPTNILFPKQSLESPRVIDFGLAKVVDATRELTATGSILGTPSYMAPEQTRSGHVVGPPADVWALGAILYECLTGRPPFKGETVLDTLEQIRRDDPLPIRQLRRSIPRDLETICMKCLNKIPDQRYVDAGQFGDDLDRFANGIPVQARRPSMAAKIRSWICRRPMPAALMLLAWAAIVALLSQWAIFTTRLQVETTRAIQESSRARDAELAAETKRRDAELARDDADRQRNRAEAILRFACTSVDENAWMMVQRKNEIVKEFVPGSILYNLARVNALASAAARDDARLDKADRNKLADQFAARAVDLLRHAQGIGYFEQSDRVKRFRAESDLASLRDRPDFKKLHDEIANPSRVQ